MNDRDAAPSIFLARGAQQLRDVVASEYSYSDERMLNLVDDGARREAHAQRLARFE